MSECAIFIKLRRSGGLMVIRLDIIYLLLVLSKQFSKI